MTKIDRIKHQLSLCSAAERQEIFRHLREEFPIHPLEAQLHTKAEIILEAIERAGGLTLRMMRGVLAEAAFGVLVDESLRGWRRVAQVGDLPYDYLLEDGTGQVRVQVKLQRSKENRPMQASEADRTFPANLFVVETQKTRRGAARKTGGATRPYRFGEFDLLAVAMYPSTKRWDTFLYTVADWLLPGRTDATEIRKFQPVAVAPNDDWTDDYVEAVKWLRSGTKKTIRAT
jgi:hypothetical protein